MRYSLGLVLLLASSLLGCGDPKEPCIQAQHHLDDCLCLGICDAHGEAWANKLVCEGAILCNSRCVNDEASEGCAVLFDAYGGMPTDLSKPYLDCLEACKTP